MYSLEIINALNDLDNPAKPKGLSCKLTRVISPAVVEEAQKRRDHDACLDECQCGQNEASRY